MRCLIALLVIAIGFAGCAHIKIQTEHLFNGKPMDHDFRDKFFSDREECLKANGWREMTPQEIALGQALLGVADIAYSMARHGDLGYGGGTPGYIDPENVRETHLSVNEGAKACMTARGYTLKY